MRTFSSGLTEVEAQETVKAAACGWAVSMADMPEQPLSCSAGTQDEGPLGLIAAECHRYCHAQ